jgi:hypothetical protein
MRVWDSDRCGSPIRRDGKDLGDDLDLLAAHILEMLPDSDHVRRLANEGCRDEVDALLRHYTDRN